MVLWQNAPLVHRKWWGDDDLKGFAKDLMNNNPAHRPSLID
jgi:hypothetical protein